MLQKFFDTFDVPRNIQRFIRIAVWTVVGLAVLGIGMNMIGDNNNGYYQIVEAFYTGSLSARYDPGMYRKMLADVYTYKIEDAYDFVKVDDDNDSRVDVRFNDGGIAKISGNVRFRIPRVDEYLFKIHKHFRGNKEMVHECILQLVNESVILTAALMSSEEAYTTKRSAFSEMSRDQVMDGVYLTESRITLDKDPDTGEPVRKEIVDIMRGPDGKSVRKENPLEDYGIQIAQFIIKEIDYEQATLNQIKAKREALQAIATAKAAADKAIQDKKTAEETGKKAVTEAEYTARVDMQRDIVVAEQQRDSAITISQARLSVAKLNRQKAEQYKMEQILKGDGEAEKRRKVMLADGALAQRIQTYKEVIGYWAVAYAKHRPTPEIEVGNNKADNNGYSLLLAINEHVQKDLGLDLTFKPITFKPGKQDVSSK